MFRAVCNVVCGRLSSSQSILCNIMPRGSPVMSRAAHKRTPKDHDETDDEFDERMECYFNRPEIDGWELRKGLTDLAGMDAIPDPKVLTAVMCACRRVNDYAMAIRALEMVKFKCGPQAKIIYPWILKNLEPVMEELGIDTPERLGYGEPELYLPSVYNMH